MCIEHSKRQPIRVATEHITIYKVVRRSWISCGKTEYCSQWTPGRRSMDTNHTYPTSGRDIVYDIGSVRKSSLDSTPGIKEYIPLLIMQSTA